MNHHSDDSPRLPEDLQQILQEAVPETAAPVIEDEIQIQVDTSQRQRSQDDRLVTRFFGVCGLLISAITLLPAVYYLFLQSAPPVDAVDLPRAMAPRWVYLSVFLAAVHALYAVFVIQVVDFSAVQTMAIFFLVIACVYAFAAMALWLSDASGWLSQFLQISAIVKPRATIWCGILFGMTALGSYVFGREALLWRRRNAIRTELTT